MTSSIEHRLPQLRGLAGDSLADFDAAPLGEFRRIADLEAEAQLLRLLVEQQNREDLVVDDLADNFGDAAHGRIQIKRGRQHIGHVEQQRLDRQAIRFGKNRTHSFV